MAKSAGPRRTAPARLQRPADLAFGRWLGDFEPLSTLEKRLVKQCAQGEGLSLGNEQPKKPLKSNLVRAAIVRFLLLGGDASHPVHESGVHVQGAWIEGELDLQYSSCRVMLLAIDCTFDSEIVAAGATIPALNLTGSSLPSLAADGLRTAGDLVLAGDFKATGEVRLVGAEVMGDLVCSGGIFSGVNGDCIYADRIRVKGGVFLNRNFRATGEVRMLGAEIGGSFSCIAGTFLNEGGRALSADGLRVAGGMFLSGGFTASGEVRLLSAEIGGALSCNGGKFSNKDDVALIADGITVNRNVTFSEDFKATGEVRLLGAEIGGILSCTGGTFSNEKGKALSLDRIKVRGGVFLRDGFDATGEVRLLGAEIGGDLTCINGKFSNPDGDAISADSIEVRGSIFLRGGFSAVGEVRLLGAKIGQDLSCINGTIDNRNGCSLNLSGASIGNGLFLRDGIFYGRIDLTAANANTLIDNPTPYQDNNLLLNGFRYNRIIGSTTAAVRVAWLMRQHDIHLGADFTPQPWEQLVRVLRDMGHPAEAAQVAMAKQEALRNARQIGVRRPNASLSGFWLAIDKGWSSFSNLLARRLHWFYGWIAGYGHRPSRIVWRMALVCALCSLAYYGGRYGGFMGPSAPVLQMHVDLRRCGSSGDPGTVPWTSPNCPMPPEYSTFQPFFYSLDVLIPFVDLHQETEWGPVVANSQGETLWWGRALRWLLWFEIIFGWIASVMFVGIISRLVDKD